MKYLDAYEENHKIVVVTHLDETKVVDKSPDVVLALSVKGLSVEGTAKKVPDPNYVMNVKWTKYRPQPINESSNVMQTEQEYMDTIKRETELLAASELDKMTRKPIAGFK